MIRNSFVAAAIVLAAGSAQAAHPFYVNMLDRGVASAKRGANAEALRELQIAAFGLVNDLPQYQTAQIHLAIVAQKLDRPELVKAAASRVAYAEQIRASYATLQVPSATKQAFETIAGKVLLPEQLALLNSVVDQRASVVITPSAQQKPPAPTPVVVETIETVKEEPKPKAPARDAVAPAAETAARPSPPSADAQIAARLAAADRLLAGGDKASARSGYLAVGQIRGLARPHLLDAARGLHRTGAWQESASIYQRAYPLRQGEEAHMFHEAVNRFQLGELNLARLLFQRAEPALPASAEVTQFRARLGLR